MQRFRKLQHLAITSPLGKSIMINLSNYKTKPKLTRTKERTKQNRDKADKSVYIYIFIVFHTNTRKTLKTAHFGCKVNNTPPICMSCTRAQEYIHIYI